MTTLFAFKIKNAWVLVADKLGTNSIHYIDKESNEEDIRYPYRTLPAGVERKIISYDKEELIFSGVNSQEDIRNLANELSSNCSTLNDCISYIKKNMRNPSFTTAKKEWPILLIISKKEQKCAIINFPQIDKTNENIIEIDDIIILGGGERSIFKASIEIQIRKYLDKEIADNKKEQERIAIECAKMLDYLWIGLHKDDLQLTGPASFIGCDVWIIKDSKITKINVVPKDYGVVIK